MQGMRSGSVQHEIAPEQQRVLIVVELAASEAALQSEKDKGPRVPRLEVKLVERDLWDSQAYQTGIEAGKSRIDELVTVASVYS